MSHSQFHSTNLFILRHAWLNLWDKHMTTGRINQVTTVRTVQARTPLLEPEGPFSTGVRHLGGSSPQNELCRNQAVLSAEAYSVAQASNKVTLYLVLAHFRPFLSVSRRDADRGLPWGLPATGTPNRGTRSRGGSPSGYLHQVWPSASNPHPSASPVQHRSVACTDSTGSGSISSFNSLAFLSRASIPTEQDLWHDTRSTGLPVLTEVY